MATALDTYLDQCVGQPDNTLAARYIDNSQFIQWLRDRGLDDGEDIRWSALDDETVGEYVDVLKGKYAVSSANRKTTIIRVFLRWLQDQRQPLEPAVVESMHAPYGERPMLKNPLTWERLKQLISQPYYGGSKRWKRDSSILSVLACTGCFVSELVKLDRRNIIISEQSITFPMGRQQPRTVPINEWAWERWILPYLESTPHDSPDMPLFLNHVNQRFSRAGIWLLVKRYLREIDETDVNLLDIRFSVVRMIVERGGNVDDVVSTLGVTQPVAYRQVKICRS